MTYRRWASLHRIIGLALLLHWSLIALTGVLLVFHRDIEQGLLGSTTAAERAASLNEVTEIVAAARPGDSIQQIATLNGSQKLLRIRIKPQGGELRSIVFDAGQRRIVGDSPLSGSGRPDGALQFVYRLHQTLLLGDGGKTLVAISGLFLIFMAFAGYRLLWPQRRHWRRIVRPRLTGNARQKMTLVHRSIGIIAGPTIVILALTGAGMNWTPPIKSAFTSMGLAEATPALPGPKGPPRLGIDEALAAAQRRFPGSAFTSVTLPQDGSALYGIRLRQPREAHAIFGMTNVQVDGVTGKILAVSDPRQAKVGDKLLEWLFAVHNGEILNLPGRVLVLLAGLALLALSLLGGAAWWRTPPRGKRSKA